MIATLLNPTFCSEMMGQIRRDASALLKVSSDNLQVAAHLYPAAGAQADLSLYPRTTRMAFFRQMLTASALLAPASCWSLLCGAVRLFPATHHLAQPHVVGKAATHNRLQGRSQGISAEVWFFTNPVHGIFHANCYQAAIIRQQAIAYQTNLGRHCQCT